MASQKELLARIAQLEAENEQLKARPTVQVSERKRKLTEEDVRNMRTEFANGSTISGLSRKYGISTTFVRHVVVARDVYRDVR